VRSAHDCAEGGLVVALAECCISGHFGAVMRLEHPVQRWDEFLFGEAAGQILVSVQASKHDEWEDFLRSRLDQNWSMIGLVTLATLQIFTPDNTYALAIPVQRLRDRWLNAIQSHFPTPAP
jgi:phosphoribosylformylglycinamidine synthase